MIREIARLDENGVIAGIESCGEDRYRTDVVERTVMLESGHDMTNHIGNYRYDWNLHTFLPVSMQPLDVAERDTAELVEGLIDAIEDMAAHLKGEGRKQRTLSGARPPKTFELSSRTERVLKEFRRDRPRRDEGKA